jgi:hypothetical protein
VFIGVVVVAIFLAAVALWWQFAGPSARVNVSGFNNMKKLQSVQTSPSQEQMRLIQEYKKAHPGATTRF